MDKLTVAQRLVRLALKDNTMVGLAEDLCVTRQTIHLWNKGEAGITKKHIAALMAHIGMEEADLEDARKEVLELRVKYEELRHQLWDMEEELGCAQLELKGFLNGTTESEMKAVSLRFAALIDRENGLRDVAVELAKRFTDSKEFPTKQHYIERVEKLAKKAAAEIISTA